jgi:hypothetical protein
MNPNPTTFEPRALFCVSSVPAPAVRRYMPRRAGTASLLALGLALGLALAGCGGGSSNDSTTVAGNISVAYAKRVNTAGLDPLTGASFVPGGDLIIREVVSASAPEYNVTTSITQGVGDVTDPEVSYDGTKIVFAMNCPASNTATTNGAAACTGHWNIWEYDMSAGITAGTLRRITSSQNDDVGPNYLPAGAGYVFSSNRQTTSYKSQALGQSYYALDEYEREQVFNLHTMDANGGSITQISFNQSHDRNPVVRPDGSIMFSRWEHVADRNRFTVFTVKPDGTNMFVLYGAHADGTAFLHPRDMDPSGAYAGYISSDLMALDRTHGGGALMMIDAANYTDQNTPVSPSVPTTGGQVQATSQQLNYGTGPSLYGRVTTPYPLWDGTNRFLVSFAPCEVSNAGVVVSCATLPAAELAALSDTNRLTTQIAADPVQDTVPPSYSVYMFDPAAQTWLLVAAPPTGFMYTDPIPIQARAEPSSFTPTVSNQTLADQNMATLTVASVFDTDLLGRMGQGMLAAADLPAGCTNTTATPANAMIPQTTPLDSQDTRPTVANILALKDPANPAYNCSPVRFIRAIRAVAPPSGSTGERQAIGNTNFEQNQILGYAAVEPDGSFQINIPANTPIAFSVLDAQGRSFQVHTNWIQARPGEIRSCDGCHSPRKGAAINSGTIANTVPAAWLPALAAAHQTGDTMAQTHANYVEATTTGITALNNPVFNLAPNMIYTDVWANTSQTGVTARPAIQLDYSGLTTAAPATTGTLAGIINYPDHIQPLWSASRGANTCTTCHNASDALLNLTATVAGTGRYTSYENLTKGAPVIQNGQPVLIVQDGVQVVETGPALVYSTASESQAVGLARQSRLVEILSGQMLMSGSAAQAAYPTPATPNHAGMLNASEMRLLVEWIDLGGKYYNDPFNSSSGVITISSLSQTAYQAQVYPILLSTCAANCHMARGSNSTVPAGTSFVENKFVLTGNPTGDFNNTLSMISDMCNPADSANYLLSMPSTVPHPTGAVGQTAAVLPATSANYATIANWIKSGCTTP